MGEIALDYSLLDHVDVQKGRRRDTAAVAKGISTRYYWIGRFRASLEGAYEGAGTKSNAIAIRDRDPHVCMRHHGCAAAPLLVVALLNP